MKTVDIHIDLKKRVTLMGDNQMSLMNWESCGDMGWELVSKRPISV